MHATANAAPLRRPRSSVSAASARFSRTPPRPRSPRFRFQKFTNGFRDVVQFAQIAFPDCQNAPSQIRQIDFMPPIAFPRPLELRTPVRQVRFRQAGDGTFGIRVPVPETSVHKNNGFVPRQNEIGRTRQIPPMKPESIAHPMDKRSHRQLRLHVARPDSRHAQRTIRRGQIVSHRTSGKPPPLLRPPICQASCRTARPAIRPRPAG